MVELSGGNKLEAALAEISKNVTKKATLSVGFMGGATYPNGTLVALVAAIQEFGAPARNIPPRPFFRNMIASKSEEWGPALGQLLVNNDYNSDRSLSTLGLGIEGQLKQSIVDTNSPPLAPSTVARKGNDKPLIDTGHMLNSITSKVE